LSYILKITVLIFVAVSLYSQNFQLKFLASFGDFKDASSLVVDQYNNIYVTDAGNNCVCKYSSEFKLLVSSGGYGWNNNSFDTPLDIVTSFDLFVYVCDFNNNRLQRLNNNLSFISSITSLSKPGWIDNFGYPKSIAQAREGELFFIDGEKIRIVKLDMFRNFVCDFGGLNSGAGILQDPSKIRIDYKNNIFVADNKTVLLFDIFGNFLNSAITDSKILGITFYKYSLVLLQDDKIKLLDFAPYKETTILLNEILKDNKMNEVITSVKDIYIKENRLYLLNNKSIFVFEIIN
jgi:hypothetical protein